MPYQIEMLVEDALIRVTMEGAIRAEDFNPLTVETVHWLDKVENGKAIIWYDINKLQSITPYVLRMNDTLQPIIHHPSFDSIVTSGTGDNIVIKFVVRTLNTLSNASIIKLFSTNEKAIQHILSLKPEIEESLRRALNNHTV